MTQFLDPPVVGTDAPPPGAPLPLPTPGQVNGGLPYPYSDAGAVGQPLRVTVAGPPPFNTLAAFRQRAYLTPFVTSNYPGLIRRRYQVRTGLTINGYDPTDPRQAAIRHSCTGTVQMMQILNGGDNAVFVYALDAVARPDPAGGSSIERNGYSIDPDGNVYLVLDVAAAVAAEAGGAWADLSCWVLFYESAPPAPKSLAAGELTDAASSAAMRLDAYRAYLGRPGAQTWLAAKELHDLARTLGSARFTTENLDAQQLVVEAVAATPSGSVAALEYLLKSAEERHNLIYRLHEVGRDPEAVDLVDRSLADYQSYVSTDGADLALAAHDLHDLAIPFSRPAVGAPAALVKAMRTKAVQVEQACVDTYLLIGPVTAEVTALTAEAQHDLVARLVDDDRAARAVPLVSAALAGYQRYVQTPGADVSRVVTDLRSFVGLLIAGGLLPQAAAAQAVLDGLEA